MARSFSGTVTGNIIEARFAFAGKAVSVVKKVGDPIKQWEHIASLDRKTLQAELDRQLADYEKVRAEFELFNLKAGGDGDDVTKFLRVQKQASLNASVKEVELAKYKLDQAVLVSPVNGIIVDMGGLVAGLFVTPASYPVKILDGSSIGFMFDVKQTDLRHFVEPVEVGIKVSASGKKHLGKTIPPALGKHGTFSVFVVLEDASELLVGMEGHVSFPA